MKPSRYLNTLSRQIIDQFRKAFLERTSPPFRYQMKWAMPSEANSSPAFHVVRPLTVPPHSFFQMRLPISRACASESSTVCVSAADTVATRRNKKLHMPISLSGGPEARKGRVLFRSFVRPDNRLAQNEKTAKIGHHDLGSMTNPTRQKPLPKADSHSNSPWSGWPRRSFRIPGHTWRRCSQFASACRREVSGELKLISLVPMGCKSDEGSTNALGVGGGDTAASKSEASLGSR